VNVPVQRDDEGFAVAGVAVYDRAAPAADVDREEVLVLARRRRPWWLLAAAVLVAGLLVHADRRADQSAAQPTSLDSIPVPAIHQIIAVIAGTAGIDTLTVGPDVLSLIDPETMRTRRSLTVPCVPHGLFGDPQRRLVWVRASCASRVTGLIAYDDTTLVERQRILMPLPVRDAAALDDVVWLATASGMLAVDDTGVVRPVRGSLPNVTALTADRNRGRVLAVTGDTASRLVIVDARSRTAVGGPRLPVTDASIAVVADKIWVAGYARHRFVVQLPAGGSPAQWFPETLPINGAVGAGAQVWPGDSVVWVSHGTSDALSCVDPVSGRTIKTWPQLPGPVASQAGFLYAPLFDKLVRLPLPAECPG
jgi:hypothetical protein